jgi:phosphonate transport system ATP-binding protein
MDTLKWINAERGITVICNLHSLEVARAFADRVVGLRDGKLIFDGPVGKLTDAALSEIYGAEGEIEERGARAAA